MSANFTTEFDELYYGESTDFMNFCEEKFLKEKNGRENIEDYMGEYYKWCDILSKSKQEGIIKEFNNYKLILIKGIF